MNQEYRGGRPVLLHCHKVQPALYCKLVTENASISHTLQEEEMCMCLHL